MQFEALNSLPYRRFWLGSIASIGSTQLYFIGMAWLVFELSGSALDLGLLGAVTAIPTITATLVGGILADRFNRRSILVVTTSLSAVLLLVLTILDATGVVLVWHVLILSGILGLVQGFDFPARSSIFPALIESNQMMSAVALNSILWQGTRMILPGIGGILIAIADTAFVFGVCAVGFVAMVCVLHTINVDQSSSGAGKRWREFSEGARFVIQNQLFRTLIILTFSMHFFVTSYIQIMPIFADLLGTSERGYGLLISITGVGSVIGTFSIARFQQSRQLGRVIFMSAALSPTVLLGFALLTSIPVTGELGFILASIFVALSAAFGGAFLVGSMTVLQLIVPDELRGRVMGIHSITFSLIALGGLMTGTLASTFSAPIAVIIGSALSLTLVFWAMFRHKEIWYLDGQRL